MKKLLFLLTIILFSANSFAQSFVSPIDFKPTDENKQKVVSFIEKQVKQDMAAIGMDDPSSLRMMEKENLNAFMKLIKIDNDALLQDVIKSSCDIGMCNYTTILMMYQEQNKASQEKLKW